MIANTSMLKYSFNTLVHIYFRPTWYVKGNFPVCISNNYCGQPPHRLQLNLNLKTLRKRKWWKALQTV